MVKSTGGVHDQKPVTVVNLFPAAYEHLAELIAVHACREQGKAHVHTAGVSTMLGRITQQTLAANLVGLLG